MSPLIFLVEGNGETQFFPAVHNFYTGNPRAETSLVMEGAGNLAGPASGAAFGIQNHLIFFHRRGPRL
jgi:hypothetical protein